MWHHQTDILQVGYISEPNTYYGARDEGNGRHTFNNTMRSNRLSNILTPFLGSQLYLPSSHNLSGKARDQEHAESCINMSFDFFPLCTSTIRSIMLEGLCSEPGNSMAVFTFTLQHTNASATDSCTKDPFTICKLPNCVSMYFLLTTALGKQHGAQKAREGGGC